MGKIESSKDLIMLMLYAKGHSGMHCESIKGKTRLMKMVFLFDKEIRKQFNLEKAIDKVAIPDFIAHDYGPFSANVYEDMEFLVNAGFISTRISAESEGAEKEEYDYWVAKSKEDAIDFSGVTEFSLTDVGRDFVKDELKASFTDAQWNVLDKFKAKCTGIPLNTLLKYVYSKYPDMTEKSKIKAKVLGKDETEK